MRSLAFKWTLTLLLTSLIGVAVAGFFASNTARIEYDRLRIDQARAWFIENVTAFYTRNKTWNGLTEWLRYDQDETVPPSAARPPLQFALLDDDGVVVLEHGPFRFGDLIDADVIRQGVSLTINGRHVGTVMLVQPPELDRFERGYMENTNRALIIGAVGAGTTALIVGLLLSRQFLRPLSDLSRAISAMHTGDLNQRVQIRSRDELGMLAQTFNEMSANLSRANQLRQQMTADIAHDLRTPLTVIGGYLEALQEGTLKPTPERFRVMREEVTLLHRLVEDLRTLSLADAGELKLMRAAFAPRELFARVAESFGASAQAAGVSIHSEIEDTVPDIWGDGERLVQVLGNLVSNALRHTPSGGTITLGACGGTDGVMLSVTDTGAGISSDDLPRIFDRFYRGDVSRQGNTGESGLGLAIVKSIVEAHGGTVRAESRLGEGTRMLLTVPAFIPRGASVSL